MFIRAGSWARRALFLIVIAAASALPATTSRAQFGNGLGLPGATLPDVPPQGAWGEVIMANAKWLVVQNHEGQQFPVSAQMIERFLVRWPITPDALTQDSLVEAMGRDVGSNTLRTDHVDVYEGADRLMVSPTLRSLLLNDNRAATAIDPAYNRVINAFDITAQYSLYGWAYPVAPGEVGVPARLYAVGSVVALDPLRLAVPGNNVATVAPIDEGGISMTQVTRGSTSFAQKGDIVFLVTSDVTPKSLAVSQLVLYKKIPRSRFVPE